MVAVFGRVKKQKAPRAAGETAELRQMEALEGWAASLKAKQLAAGRADRREQSLEGLYWLAVLKGKAYTLAKDTVVNTDTIRVGYLVLRVPLGLKGWALGRLRLKRLKAGHGPF